VIDAQPKPLRKGVKLEETTHPWKMGEWIGCTWAIPETPMFSIDYHVNGGLMVIPRHSSLLSLLMLLTLVFTLIYWLYVDDEHDLVDADGPDAAQPVFQVGW
jgi:hypothetical protein